ncbi:MAG: helix-hairpin-helix domain-containing protein [Verrucomicrobia bacterium]|nr:helix-hairpin-helix domain-containing protein [Cytophagales bacterium]
MLIVFLVFIAFSAKNLAQNYPLKDIDIDAFILDLFNQQDEDINYEDLYEALFQLYTDPLDLNQASRDELGSLFVLSQEQINNLLKHRQENGKMVSIYELQAIEGLDLTTINKLLPFVKVDNEYADQRPLLKKIWDEPNHYVLLRYGRVFGQRKGFTAAVPDASGDVPQRYQGSPDKLYLRYRVSHPKDYSFGFTTEKDAGEQIVFDNTTTGFDFWSFHAQIQNRGSWKNITLGDYQLQFGQGLVLSAGFAVGKGSETINTVKRNNLGIRPYSSVLETGYFRGGAATYTWKNFDITTFYANNRRDANLVTQDDTLAEEAEDFVSSLLIAGFHRTPNEIATKNRIREQNIGGNITYQSKNNNLQAGITALYTDYGISLQRQPTVYNQFEFRGRQNLVLGGNFTYIFENINFFGELARSQSGGLGLVSGLVSSLSRTVEMAMLYRRFDKNFHSFYANAFGENTRNINENGWYWGLKYTPFRKLVFSAYYDKFSFPWLKFGVDAPSQGYEYLFRITYKPVKTIALYAQYREENKDKNQPDNNTNIDFITSALRRNYLLTADFNAQKNFFLRSRVQWSSYHIGSVTTKGFAVIQDVNFAVGKFELSSRFALFDTEDFNNRQYVYEKDVLYAFSIPAYNGQGLRNYFLMQYTLTKKIDCWLRYSQTRLRNAKTIGSGLDEIKGNTLQEIKMQVRIKL